MSCNCNNCQGNCSNYPIVQTTGTQQFNPCYEIDYCTTGCEETLSSKCVVYEGPTLQCEGFTITHNQDLQVILTALHTQICQLKTQIVNLSDQLATCCTNTSGLSFVSLGAIGCDRAVNGLIGVLGLSNPLAVGESIVVKYNNTILTLGVDYSLSRVGDVWRVNVNYNSGDSGVLRVEATNSLGSNFVEYTTACPCDILADNVVVTCLNGQNTVTMDVTYVNAGPQDLYVIVDNDMTTFTQTTSPQTITFNVPDTAGSFTVEYGIVDNTCINYVDIDTVNCCYINPVQTNATCTGDNGGTANYFVTLNWLNALNPSGTITVAVTGSGGYTHTSNIAYNTVDGSQPIIIQVPLSVLNVQAHIYFTSDNGCEATIDLDYPICG